MTLMIEPLLQPVGSALCGQTCIAMAAGITVSEAMQRTRRYGATTSADLVMALTGLGFKTAKGASSVSEGMREESLVKQLPMLYSLKSDRAILRIKWDGRYAGHWVLWWDGHLYDPELGVDPDYTGVEHGRIVSKLLIHQRENPCLPIHQASVPIRKRTPRRQRRTSRRSRMKSSATTPASW